VFLNGQKVGDLTNAAWSYRLKQNIGFTLISVGARPGDTVEVQRASGRVRGTLCELPFL
jgi:glycine cleavage system aminomethyltransferase T